MTTQMATGEIHLHVILHYGVALRVTVSTDELLTYPWNRFFLLQYAENTVIVLDVGLKQTQYEGGICRKC